MTNYIKRLQSDVTKRESTLENLATWKQAFRAHLELDKFKGVDSSGERKDWIATSDVLKWLESMPFNVESEESES